MKKRILAIAVVFAMLFAFNPAMFVSAVVAPPSITINAPDNISLQGQTLTAYRIFDMQKVTGSDAGYDYTITAPFADFSIGGQTLKEYLYDKDNSNTGGTALLPDKEIEINAALKAYIDGKISGDSDYFTSVSYPGTTSTAPYKQIVIDNVPLGYYMVMGGGRNITDVDADTNDSDLEVTSLIILTTTDSHAVVTLKADAPGIDKKVKHGTAWGDYTDVNVGDTVEFMITSKVPSMRGYTSYTFNVIDTMSKGLTYKNDISVQVGGANADATVTVTTDSNDNTVITVTFNDFYDNYKIKTPQGRIS
jgi:fimbrial isopeptide formation D2 family protein